jgi:DNA-binding MarR family transcriptional regulator
MLLLYSSAVPGARTPLASTGFLLSKIGQLTTERFAEKLAALELRPRHCGLLAAIAALPSTSQEELSRAVGLVPSAIVGMVDDLERLGAVRRVVDADNRRRYSIELTRRGQTLLARSAQLAREVDEEILRSLGTAQRTALAGLLGTVAAALGLPAGFDKG